METDQSEDIARGDKHETIEIGLSVPISLTMGESEYKDEMGLSVSTYLGLVG